MPHYRNAKTAELDLLFNWLENQLSTLKQANPQQAALFARLDQAYQQAEGRLALLQAMLALNDPRFDKQIDNFSHDLCRYVIPTSNHYIAGLRRQGPDDLRVRDILMRMCQRLQLNWIEDVLVCLHHDLALLPEYRGLYSIPVFFGPPHLLVTILEMPGIYHEFGHSAFARDPVFLDEMSKAVTAHFSALKQQAGPMPPAQKDLRDKEIDKAAANWTPFWLAEIFCDLFAGYICGPANVASMIDLGRAHGRGPFLLTSNSHPPNGARVISSYFALSDAQRQDPLMVKIWAAWTNFTGGFNAGSDYKLSCSDDLLRLLADTVNNLIATHLPNIPRYTKLPTTLADAKNVQAGLLLEDLLNAGVTILFEAPADFEGWLQTARPLIS